MKKTLYTLTAVALFVAGCSSSTSSTTTQDRVVIDVTIKGGTVTPTDEQVQAKVRQPIVVRVNSDAVDQLHVHSNPEHTFDITPGSGEFPFTVDVPGKVDVELHHLDKTIATITVQ